MRAAIYARYSSDQQRDASIDDQVRICRSLIKQDGLRLVDTYSDHAISGASSQRPGYQAMLVAAQAGGFDVIVAEALDRLSRDLGDVAQLYKQLTFLGIRLVTLSEGEISELHVGLKGTMNALFLKDLADKTRRGLRGRVEQGRSGGGNAYGYDVVRRFVEGRNTECGKRRINTGETAIVRRIFEAYASGSSPRRIALQLNQEGIPGPSGKAWGSSTINGNRARGTGILNNELYIGRLVWNRLRYIKDPVSGKRVSRLNPPEVWVTVDVPELRIVDDTLWENVKRRQDAMTRDTRPDRKEPIPFWAKARPRYLLSGLMKCGSCGGGYVKISAYAFGCATARNKGTCDNRLTIRRDTLEATILDGLKTRLMEPALFEVFATEFLAEWNRLLGERNAKLSSAKSQITRIDARIDRLVDAIADGADALPLNAKIKDLEAQKAPIQDQLASGTVDAPLIHPNLAKLYREKIETLADALEAQDTQAEAFEIIRSLVDKVVLTPVDDELCIDLHGQLAGILQLCDLGKERPAASYEERALQIKMVAGARYQRYLQISEGWLPRVS
jgi:DNA invertase Pin-like site-specific DNA recombinase